MTNLSTSPIVGTTHQQTIHKDNMEQRNTVSSSLSLQTGQNNTNISKLSSADSNISNSTTAINTSSQISSPSKTSTPKISSDGNYICFCLLIIKINKSFQFDLKENQSPLAP